jgi:hypothetical protein
MIGIVVHGDNHFIVDGPRPDFPTARALVRHWSIIQIGASTPPELSQWRIINKAFRENLEWAVIVPAPCPISPAVLALLKELEDRGIPSTHGDD